MALKVGNFYVKDIVFGDKTKFSDGLLTVNKEEAIAHINPEGKLKNIELYVVHPGDSVRIAPAKAAVAVRFRPDGRCIFPGYTGAVSKCGEGIIYAMQNTAVIASGKYSNMDNGIVDMSGPGAQYSALSQLVNLVIYAERVNEKDLELTLRVEEEHRLAAHLLSEYIGKALEGQEPEEWEIYDLETKAAEAEEKKLPRVAAFLTVVSQLEAGLNEKFAGRDCHNMAPVFIHPNEILDGYVVAGQCEGQAMTTYDAQNLPLIRRLYKEHGKTVNFVGVILVPADVSDEVKNANKLRSGEMASLLKLDAAVIVEWGGGSNIDVDFFYNVAELESRGVKTVGITCEHAGKMTVDPRAVAIVSTGETSAILELPPMEHVIGDLESIVRDYYFGTWPTHSIYGPSLRPDGSIIINSFALSGSGNNTGWLCETVKDF